MPQISSPTDWQEAFDALTALDATSPLWCGTMPDLAQPVVLIACPGREIEAATRLGRIGFDDVAGYLAGGMQPLDDAPELVERIERITAGSLAEQLAAAEPPAVVDVRTTASGRPATSTARPACREPAAPRGPRGRHGPRRRDRRLGSGITRTGGCRRNLVPCQ